MNEFTKEELIDLHYAIRFFWKNRCSYDLPSDEEDFTKSHDLMEKLQSMIDNYCDHEYKKTLDKSGMYFINMCHKCEDSKPWTIFDEMQS